MAQEVPTGGVVNETQDRGTSEGGVLGQHQEHKPGMAEKFKLTFASVKERVAGGGGSTPTNIETGHHHQSKAEDFKDDVTPGAAHHRTPPLDGGRVGDIASPRPTGSPRSFREGEPASPRPPHKDIGERIIDKLPGSHSNPYSVGHNTQPEGTNPYVSSNDPVTTTHPAGHHGGEQSPGFMGKIKNMVTGQKPTQGTGTENATTATTGTTGATGETTYAQSPTPQKTGDFYERTKGKLGMGGKKGPDAGSEEAWPSPSKPDYHNKPGATFTTEEGHPIEGPTQPKSEDTKKEGLMTKIMDKFHISEKSSTSPKAGSPTGTTGTTGTGTSTI